MVHRCNSDFNSLGSTFKMKRPESAQPNGTFEPLPLTEN